MSEHRISAPDDITEVEQWVLWRRERDTKVPYRIDGRRASTVNPQDWSDYEAVVRTLEQHPHEYAGIGFVFRESDPFVGLDLDDSLEDTTGNPKSWCRVIVERFSDTYMEISPSGLGLKIWCRGKLPAAVAIAVQDGRIEMYDRGRYFTVTGNVFRGAPLQVEDHAADVLSLFVHLTGRSANGCEMPKYAIPVEGKIPKGTQHLTLVSLAGTLRRRGVCDEAIDACLQAVNRYQCEQPGPAENISRIMRSTRSWGRP
jgi:hypothetical protein